MRVVPDRSAPMLPRSTRRKRVGVGCPPLNPAPRCSPSGRSVGFDDEKGVQGVDTLGGKQAGGLHNVNPRAGGVLTMSIPLARTTLLQGCRGLHRTETLGSSLWLLPILASATRTLSVCSA